MAPSASGGRTPSSIRVRRRQLARFGEQSAVSVPQSSPASRAGGMDDVGSLAAKSGVAAVPADLAGYGTGRELPP